MSCRGRRCCRGLEKTLFSTKDGSIIHQRYHWVSHVDLGVELWLAHVSLARSNIYKADHVLSLQITQIYLMPTLPSFLWLLFFVLKRHPSLCGCSFCAFYSKEETVRTPENNNYYFFLNVLCGTKRFKRRCWRFHRDAGRQCLIMLTTIGCVRCWAELLKGLDSQTADGYTAKRRGGQTYTDSLGCDLRMEMGKSSQTRGRKGKKILQVRLNPVWFGISHPQKSGSDLEWLVWNCTERHSCKFEGTPENNSKVVPPSRLNCCIEKFLKPPKMGVQICQLRACPEVI